MAAWTSRRRFWQNLTRSSPLLFLAILAQGCSSEAPAPRAAFADLQVLARMHPANPALRELERQMRAAAPFPATAQPLDLAPPSAPPAPKPSKPPEPTRQQTGLERLRRELAADLERRASLKSRELARASQAALAEQEARLASERLAQRAQIIEKRRREISRLESSIALLEQRLQSRSLAPGERTQIENRRAELSSQLDALRSDEEKELAALDSLHKQKMEEFRKQRAGQDERELANTRAALERDLERAINEHQARMRRALAPPQMPLPRSATAPSPAVPAAARSGPQPIPAPGPAQREELLAQHRRLEESTRRDTAETAKALAARRNIRLTLGPRGDESLPDITDEVASWLKRYWSAHSRQKEATNR